MAKLFAALLLLVGLAFSGSASAQVFGPGSGVCTVGTIPNGNFAKFQNGCLIDGGTGTGSSTPAGAANSVQYTANGTTFSGITPVNNSVVVTNGTGVPSESVTLPAGLTAGGAFTVTGNLTASNISGSTQCIHASSAGLLSGAAGDCITNASQTANKLLVAPDGSSGSPTFRAMVVGDIPTNLISYAKIQQAGASKLLGNNAGVTGNIGEISLAARLGFVAGALDINTGTITNSFLATGAASANLGAPTGDLGGPSYSGGPIVQKVNGVSYPVKPGGMDYIPITTAADGSVTTYAQAPNCTYSGYSTGTHSITCNTQPNLSLTVGNPCQQISATPIGITSGAVTINPFFAVQTTAKTINYTLVDSHSGGATDACSTILFNGSNLVATINSSSASYFPTGYPVQLQNLNASNLTVQIGTGSSTFYGVPGTGLTSFTLGQGCWAYIEADAAGAPNLYNVQSGCFGAGGGGSGNWIKLAAQTASNSATLDFTAISASYGTLVVSCNNLFPVSNAVQLRMRFGEGVGPTWEASTYEWRGDQRIASGTTITGSQSSNDTSLPADAGSQTNTGSGKETLWIRIGHFSGDGTTFKNWDWESDLYDGSGNHNNFLGFGEYYGDTNPLTGVRLFFSSGNISTGTCTLYGLTQ